MLFRSIDLHWYRHEALLPVDPTPDTHGFSMEGSGNFLALIVVMALVLMSGSWRPGVAFEVAGTEVEWQQLVRDVLLLGVAAVSWWLTPMAVRERNQFSWGPMREVAKLFAGIFLTMVPVLAMLKAGTSGSFATVASSVNDAQGQGIPWAYFWASGLLSSFLDNAPTYLVFFSLAGGDPQQLMTGGALTDRKSTRLNSSHEWISRMPSSA